MRNVVASLIAAILAIASAAPIARGARKADARMAAGLCSAHDDPVLPLVPASSPDLIPVTECNLMGGQFNLVCVRNDEVFFTAGSNCLDRLDAAGH